MRSRAAGRAAALPGADSNDDDVDALLSRPDPLDESEQAALVRAMRRRARAQAASAALLLAGGLAMVAALWLWLALEQVARPFQQRHTGELRTVLLEGGGGGGAGRWMPAPFAAALGLQAAAIAAAAAATLGLGRRGRGGGRAEGQGGADPGGRAARRRAGDDDDDPDQGAAGFSHPSARLSDWAARRGEAPLRCAAAGLSSLGALYWLRALAAHGRLHPSLGVPWELAWLPLAPLTAVGAAEAARAALAATAADVDALEALSYAHKRV